MRQHDWRYFFLSAGPSHWAALTHLVGYLVHRPRFKLTYSKDSIGGFDGYIDSDRGNSLSHLSTTGLMTRCKRCPMLWRSNMQKSVALSSVEAEY